MSEACGDGPGIVDRRSRIDPHPISGQKGRGDISAAGRVDDRFHRVVDGVQRGTVQIDNDKIGKLPGFDAAQLVLEAKTSGPTERPPFRGRRWLSTPGDFGARERCRYTARRISSNMSTLLLLATLSVPSPTGTPASRNSRTGCDGMSQLQVGLRAVHDSGARFGKPSDLERFGVNRMDREGLRPKDTQFVEVTQGAHAASRDWNIAPLPVVGEGAVAVAYKAHLVIGFGDVDRDRQSFGPGKIANAGIEAGRNRVRGMGRQSHAAEPCFMRPGPGNLLLEFGHRPGGALFTGTEDLLIGDPPYPEFAHDVPAGADIHDFADGRHAGLQAFHGAKTG